MKQKSKEHFNVDSYIYVKVHCVTPQEIINNDISLNLKVALC